MAYTYYSVKLREGTFGHPYDQDNSKNLGYKYVNKQKQNPFGKDFIIELEENLLYGSENGPGDGSGPGDGGELDGEECPEDIECPEWVTPGSFYCLPPPAPVGCCKECPLDPDDGDGPGPVEEGI